MALMIGELAKRAGVTIQTIRYYERRGLVHPSQRRPAGISGVGYRIYNEDAVKRLKFILHAKELGFTLNETEELLGLKVSEKARCGDIKKKAGEKLEEIDKKIQGLQGIQKILKDLIKTCKERQATEKCPILKAIDEKEDKGVK